MNNFLWLLVPNIPIVLTLNHIRAFQPTNEYLLTCLKLQWLRFLWKLPVVFWTFLTIILKLYHLILFSIHFYIEIQLHIKLDSELMRRLFIFCQMSYKFSCFLFFHFKRMIFSWTKDKPFYPIDVRFFSSQAVMLDPNNLSYLVK